MLVKDATALETHALHLLHRWESSHFSPHVSELLWADLFLFGRRVGEGDCWGLVECLCDILLKAFSIFYSLFTPLCLPCLQFSCSAFWFVLTIKISIP